MPDAKRSGVEHTQRGFVVYLPKKAILEINKYINILKQSGVSTRWTGKDK